MSPDSRILVLPQQCEIGVTSGSNLFQILAEAGLSLNQACGGRGLCGKCRVRLLNHAPLPTVLDREHLSRDEIDRGVRLACGVEPRGGEIVELPAATAEPAKLDIGRERFPVHPWPDTQPDDLVLAIDLGTTNVVGHLLDARTGEVLQTACSGNGQAVFGADVMTRLTYASKGGTRARERLRSLSLSDIENLAESFNVQGLRIRLVMAVMNSAMETLLLGLDPDKLGRYPYEIPVREAVHAMPFRTKVLARAELHIPPVVGGFVGSDTTAAMLATAELEPEPPYLLLDIGTNSEAVLVNGEMTIACSSAAGPAFEAGTISCGMRAVEGSIERVKLDGRKLHLTVIGGGKPRGITGSGLFSLLGELLRAGALDAFGALVIERFNAGQLRTGRGGRELLLAPHVTVSESDVQQFLLAKASARAGIEVLLSEAGLVSDALTKIFLCGIFADHIEPDDILSLGMVPPIESGRIVGLGNMAGVGAAMMACSDTAFGRAVDLASSIRHLRLSGHPEFKKIFQEHVSFGSH
jgi:uncharacterized 2Fe-2S/4Fe-4S cluster protein (DUF4445 family)